MCIRDSFPRWQPDNGIPQDHPAAKRQRGRSPRAAVPGSGASSSSGGVVPPADEPVAGDQGGDPDSDNTLAEDGVPPPPAPVESDAQRKMRRDLKADALSPRHLLTHKPKNPYCDSCVRGKMLNIKKFKGSFDRSRHLTEKFQLVTGD